MSVNEPVALDDPYWLVHDSGKSATSDERYWISFLDASTKDVAIDMFKNARPELYNALQKPTAILIEKKVLIG